jgi:hypothetical protein
MTNLTYTLYTYWADSDRLDYYNCANTVEFQSKAELFEYVKTKTEWDFRLNKKYYAILIGMITHVNDVRKYFSYSGCEFSRFDMVETAYLIKDSNGKTFDLRNYIGELEAFDVEAYRNSPEHVPCPKLEKSEAGQAYREARWALAEKLSERKSYWHYCRSVQTTQEHRKAYIEDYKGLIRGKRRPHTLPTAWNDLWFHEEKTWKARDKRARRQWAADSKRNSRNAKAFQSDYDSSVNQCDEYVGDYNIADYYL